MGQLSNRTAGLDPFGVLLGVRRGSRSMQARRDRRERDAHRARAVTARVSELIAGVADCRGDVQYRALLHDLHDLTVRAGHERYGELLDALDAAMSANDGRGATPEIRLLASADAAGIAGPARPALDALRRAVVRHEISPGDVNVAISTLFDPRRPAAELAAVMSLADPLAVWVKTNPTTGSLAPGAMARVASGSQGAALDSGLAAWLNTLTDRSVFVAGDDDSRRLTIAALRRACAANDRWSALLTMMAEPASAARS